MLFRCPVKVLVFDLSCEIEERLEISLLLTGSWAPQPTKRDIKYKNMFLNLKKLLLHTAEIIKLFLSNRYQR